MSLQPAQYSPSPTPSSSPEESTPPPTQQSYPPKKRSGGNKMPRMLADGSELVWPPDLEAALFEALSVYPPMISRRAVTVYSPKGQPSEFSNVGRCQLIQEYILKKTGKLRTRKQVASRLQRLRQTHKDEPHMMALLRSARRSPGETALPLHDESPKLMGYNMNTSTLTSPARRAGIPLKMGTLLSEDVDGHDDSGYASSGTGYPGFAPPKMDEHGIVVHAAEDSENMPPEAQDAEWAYDGSRLSSMSRRRLSSNLPALRVQVDLPPPPAHMFPTSSASSHSPEYYHQSAIPNKSYLSAEPASEGQPVTPLDQIFTAPDHPPELRRDNKRPAHFAQAYTQQELPEGIQYGLPAAAALEGSMYKGYRQPAPSSYSSPYTSPYPSPTAQYFSRHGGPGMNFEDALHHAAPPTYQLRHVMPHLHRQHSYQHAPRPNVHGYQPLPPYGYSPTHQSPLSVSYNGMPGPSSQQLEQYLPATHHAEETPGQERARGQFARAFGAMELQSPVAIRPFFLSADSSGSISTSNGEMETPPATETPAPTVKTEPGIPTEQYPQFSPQSSAHYMPVSGSPAHYRQVSGSYYSQNAGAFYGAGASTSGATHYGTPVNAHVAQSPKESYDLNSNAHYAEGGAGAPHFRSTSGEKQNETPLGQATAPVTVKIEEAPVEAETWSPSAYTNDSN